MNRQLADLSHVEIAASFLAQWQIRIDELLAESYRGPLSGPEVDRYRRRLHKIEPLLVQGWLPVSWSDEGKAWYPIAPPASRAVIGISRLACTQCGRHYSVRQRTYMRRHRESCGT